MKIHFLVIHRGICGVCVGGVGVNYFLFPRSAAPTPTPCAPNTDTQNTLRNAILQAKKFPSIDRLAAPTAPLELLLRPSVHISCVAPLPSHCYSSIALDLKFATREMTKTPQTRPKTNWKILKATGTVQYKPTYARPTKEKLAQTKKKWGL